MKKMLLGALIFLNSCASCGGCSFGTLIGLPGQPKGNPTFIIGNNIKYFDHTVSGKFNNSNYKQRLEAILKEGAIYWEDNSFKDYSIEIVEAGDSINCGLKSAGGCTNPFDKVIKINASVSDCIEDLPIIHEQGHALIGDALHLNDKFRTLGLAHKDLINADFDLEDPQCQQFQLEDYDLYWTFWDSTKGF